MIDNLLEQGYESLTLLDISENAIIELLTPFYNHSDVDATLFDLKVEYISKDGRTKLNDTTYFSDNKYLTGRDCFINSLNGWKIHNLICTKNSIFLTVCITGITLAPFSSSVIEYRLNSL